MRKRQKALIGGLGQRVTEPELRVNIADIRTERVLGICVTELRADCLARGVIATLADRDRDIRIGVGVGLDKDFLIRSGSPISTVRRHTAALAGRADHGDGTEHRKQSEVEGTHDSVAICRIVRRLDAKYGMRYL